MKRVIGLLLVCLLPYVCDAGDKHWASPVSGNFHDGSKWVPTGVPSINDDVFISTNGTFTVTVNNNSFGCRNLEIGGGSGIQTLIVTNASFFLSTSNTIVTSNGVLIQHSSSMEGGGIFNSGSVTLHNSTISANTINDGGITVENTPGGNGGIFNGTIINGPGGIITISNSSGNPSSLANTGGIFNEGQIIVTSASLVSNATTAIVLHSELTNVTGGIIVVSPNANNDGIVDIGTNGGLFNNGGEILITSTTAIIQRSTFSNSGGILVDNGRLDIIQGIGRNLDNRGSIEVRTTAELSLLSGDFFPRSGSEISGGGIFTFDAVSISNGPLLCTNSSVHFRGVTILNSTLVSNSSQMFFSGANNVQGPIENHPGGSLSIQSTTSFPFSSLQSGGGIYNGGSLFVTSASTTNFSSVQLQCNGGPFINDGNIFISANQHGPPGAFSFQDIGADGIRVENNGGIDILPGGNCFFILGSSPFVGNEGSIQVRQGGVLGLGSQTSFSSSNPIAPITTSTILVQPGARLDVFSHDPGGVFELHSNSTTSLIQNDGTILCEIPLIDPTNAPPLRGNGNLIIRDANIVGPLLPEAGPGITIQRCITSTSASLLFNGANNSILDRNTFNGSVSIATNCHVFVNNDPLGNRGADNVSDNVFSNSVLNNGSLFFNRNTKPVTLLFTSASCILTNNGSIFIHSPLHSRIQFFTSSTLLNNGSLLQTTTTASSNLRFANSSFINNGTVAFTSAIVQRTPSAGSSLYFNNSLFISSTTSRLFVSPTSTRALLTVTSSILVNAGRLHLFPFNSTKTTVSLFEGTSFENSGIFVSTVGSLRISTLSSFINSGRFEFSTTLVHLPLATHPGLLIEGGGLLLNSSSSSFTFNRLGTTATIFVRGTSTLWNKGTMDIRNSSFIGAPSSSTPAINVPSGGSIFLSTNSTLRFRNFATTATLFLGSNSRFTNFGHSSFTRDPSNLLVFPRSSQILVTHSSLLLVATNSTLRVFDYSPPSIGVGTLRIDGSGILDNGGLFVGHSLLTTATSSFYLREGSVILRNNSTFINRTTATFRFRNFATTATIFLGEATRWTNQGTSDVRSHWTPSTNSSIRISEPRMKLSSNSQFTNSGTFRFRNFATTATIFLGEATRWNNSGTCTGQARTTIATQGVFAPGTRHIQIGGTSQVNNDGTFRFRNFATTATIFLGDASRWNNSGNTDFVRTPTQGIVFDPHVFVVSTASIHNATNAIFTFRNYTAPSNHTPTVKLEDNACVESSGGMTLDTKYGTPTNATVFADDGQAHLSGSVKWENKPSGRLVFRNFATTATIFLGDASRFTNQGTTDIFKQVTSATVFIHPPSHDVELDGNALLQNATNGIFRHHNFGESGTIRLDNDSRVENHGILKLDRHPTNATVFPPTHGDGVLGTGRAIFKNDGTIHIRSFGTTATVRVQNNAQVFSTNEVGFLRRTATTATGLLSYPFQALELDGNAQVTIASTGRMFFERFEQPVLVSPDGTSRLLLRGNLDFVDVTSTSQILTLGNSFLELSNRLLVSSASLCVEETTHSSILLSTSLQITLNSGQFQYKGSPLVFSTSSSFSGSGTLAFGTTVTILGAITPGASPGQLIFNSDVVLGPETNILIEIEGQTPGLEHDNIIVNGHLVRNGTVTVTNGNYAPPNFTVFEIIQYDTVSGSWNWQGLQYPNGHYEVTSSASLTYLTSMSSTSSVQVSVNAYLAGFWDGTTGRITPVILEARTGATLSASSLVERQTALMGTTGTATADFNATSGYNWLVLRHAGSLDIGSATPLNFGTGVQADFTDPSNVHNGANALVQTTLGGVTVYILRTGDLNGDNANNATDFLQFFLPNFGRINPGSVPD